MDDDKALLIEKVAQRLVTYREELVEWLQEDLEDTLFSNRVFIRPSHLKQIAVAQADAFLGFLKNQDTSAIRVQGAKRAEEGLREQAVLRMGATLRRFCHTRLGGEFVQAGLAATDVYAGAFLEGFIEACQNIVLAEQERIRAALQRALSHYTLQLQAAAEVSHAATSILDLNELLTTCVEIIRERFDLYYAGLFLVDESGEWAILHAGTGEAGREMLRRGYKLKVGGESTVGSCIAHGQARTALDVGKEAVRFEKPCPPEMRSEIALPLISRGRVLGAMTLRRSGVAAFGGEDITTIQSMAGQLANAIENAQLFEETKRRLEEMTALYQTSLDITAQLEMSGLLKSLVERAVTLLEAKAGGIYLYDPEREELSIAIGYGRAEKCVGTTLKPGEGMAGKVFQTGEPLIVDDYRTWEGRAPVYEADQPFTAALEVPLRWQEQIIGVLAIDADVQERTFNQEDIWLATLFASQAAVAIENARLYAAGRKQLHRLEELAAASQRITADLDLAYVLEEMGAQALTTLEAERVAIFLLDWETDRLSCAYSSGLSPEYVNETEHHHRELRGSHILSFSEPIHVLDAQSDLVSEDMWEATIKEGIHTFAVLPLTSKGRGVGALAIYRDAIKAFEPEVLALAQSFANQAAVAIENARIYEEERKRIAQLELIGETTQKIASILDLDELLLQVARMIGDTFGYYQTSILLVEAGSDELVLRASVGPLGEALIDRLRLKISREGITGWVAHSGEPLLVNDTSREPRHYPVEGSQRTGSELAVPIKLKGEVIGVLDVQAVELDAFSQDDVFILQALANQLAIAIENARLYQQTDEKLQTRVKELSTLYTIAEMMNRSLDLDAVLQLALDSAIEVAGMDLGGILLLDPSTNDLFLRAHQGGSPEFIQAVSHIRADEGLMPPMLKSVLVVDDRSKLTKDCRVAIEREGLQSVVSIPVKAKESLLGVMVVASRSPRTFASQELELLATFGNQVGVAVDRANLQAQELRAAIGLPGLTGGQRDGQFEPGSERESSSQARGDQKGH
jgi:GAF domain-containing protein